MPSCAPTSIVYLTLATGLTTGERWYLRDAVFEGSEETGLHPAYLYQVVMITKLAPFISYATSLWVLVTAHIFLTTVPET